MEFEETTRAIKRVTELSVIMNFLFTILKAIVGFLGNSQAVIADAIHSLSDLVTDIAVLVGVRFWAQDPDDEHPYGHRRIESFVTMSIGIMLAGVGIKLCLDAAESIRGIKIHHTNLIAAAGPFVSIVGKEFLYRITMRTGIKVGSSALKANAWHHRSDSLSSIPAFLAVVFSKVFPSAAYIDSIGAIIVSIFIFKVSWDISKPAIEDLLDKSADPELIKSIEKGALTCSEVKSVHKIRTRKSGEIVMVDFHIQLDGSLSITEGHDICGKVKHNIMVQNPGIVDVLIHLEPEHD